VLTPTRMTLQLADRSMKYPYGVAEDVLVKVDKFMFPVDFVVMDIEEDTEVPLILGRPFMKTAKVIIDIDDGKLKVRVQDDEVNFNVFEAMQHLKDNQQCFRMDVIDEIFLSSRKQLTKASPLEKALIGACDDLEDDEEKKVDEYLTHLNSAKEIASNDIQLEKLQQENRTESQKLELKVLPPHLKYFFLADRGNKPVVISSALTAFEEEKLISVLKANKGAIGWTLSDLKGISPSYCMHKIHMEQDYKPVAQPQWRLNPTMKEVVKKEVMKLLDAGMIYPISNSAWVSPVQVVPKKGGMIVICNDKNELIPTRIVTGWRMCIDYRKLNQATRKGK